MANSLRHRLHRLEDLLMPTYPCSECKGEGRCTLAMVEYDEQIPPGGCPQCGRGHQVVIRWPQEPVPA